MVFAKAGFDVVDFYHLFRSELSWFFHVTSLTEHFRIKTSSSQHLADMPAGFLNLLSVGE